jgi:hypothetical protein
VLWPERTPPHLHLDTSSRPRCCSGEGTLCHGPLAAAAPQQASPEPLGSQGPPALSQKAPPPMMRMLTKGGQTQFYM